VVRQVLPKRRSDNPVPHPPRPAILFHPALPLLLNFQCAQAIKPYVQGKDTTGSILVDLGLSYQRGLKWKGGTEGPRNVTVRIEVDDRDLGGESTSLRFSSTGEVEIDLSALEARVEPFALESGDALNSTTVAYDLIDLITEFRDGYRPISLVRFSSVLDPSFTFSPRLFCRCSTAPTFERGSYSAGADIILMDPYPLYVNTRVSPVYNTVCNTAFGCCGTLSFWVTPVLSCALTLRFRMWRLRRLAHGCGLPSRRLIPALIPRRLRA
jgi:hypothetical protein